MTTPVQYLRGDPALLGVQSLVIVSASRMAASCVDNRRIVTLDRGADYPVAGSSADLGSEPGALMLFASALWTITKAGNLVKLTTADVPVVSVTTSIHAATNRWLASYGSVVIAPGRVGGLVTLTTSGVVLNSYEGAVAQARFAVCSASGYLYVVDDHGQGSVFTVGTTSGLLVKVGTFTAQDCQDVLGGFITGSTLVFACGARGAIVSFDISTAAAPIRSARATNDGAHVRNVLPVAAKTALTDEVVDALGLPWWYAAQCGASDGDFSIVGHARSGRVSVNDVGGVYATFDPAKIISGAALSNGNKRLTAITGAPGGFAMVANVAKRSGKILVQFQCTNFVLPYTATFGVVKTSQANDWGLLLKSTAWGFDGQVGSHNKGHSGYTVFGSDWLLNEKVLLGCDFDAGVLWMKKAGVDYGQMFTTLDLATDYYFFVQAGSNATAAIVEGNIETDPSKMTETVPSAWGTGWQGWR